MNKTRMWRLTDIGAPDLQNQEREAMFASRHLIAVSMACGHVAPIEKAMVDTDRYCCPVCGLRFHVSQSPPKVYPSGFVMPGERRVVVDWEPKL